MKIYFIRHGETLWNTLKIFQGSSNSPLTEKGREQAKKLGKKLKNIEFTNFYSSPLGRTIETSELIIGDRDIKIEFIDEFKEISVGQMEGAPREEFESKYPKEFHDFFLNPKDYDPSPYLGESYPSLLERVEKGLEKLISKHRDGDTVAVVSHGITLKAIFKIVKGMSFEELGEVPVPENTSVSIVNYDYNNKKYSIDVFSDTSHLKED